MTMPKDGSEPREVFATVVGELYLRRPNIFVGYHYNLAATECLSDDVWFCTGNVGNQDAKENFQIMDRVKEQLTRPKGF